MDAKIEFEKAIQRLKEIGKPISIKQWNKIAMQENLLCAESLKYIAQIDFVTLQEEIRAS